MVALSATTGDILWDTPLSDVPHPSTSGAIVIGDKVLMGITGCGRGADGCYISAIDINTGKRAWRFYTIPREGEPGSDTWGKLPMSARAGVETWLAGTYDPDLNLTYWGTAQSKPWSFLNRGTTPFDKTLYANSTLALNPDTGKLAWYHQHVAGESFDLDEVFERVLVDIGSQKVSFSAGKSGILWKLDRRTGQFLDSKEMVRQTVWEHIDPKTGLPTFRPDILEMQFDQTVNVCPSTARRQELASHELSPADGCAHRPTGPIVHGLHGSEDTGRWQRCRAPFPHDAKHEWQRRETGGIRCQDDAAGMEPRAAGGLLDGCHLDRRRHRDRW